MNHIKNTLIVRLEKTYHSIQPKKKKNTMRTSMRKRRKTKKTSNRRMIFSNARTKNLRPLKNPYKRFSKKEKKLDSNFSNLKNKSSIKKRTNYSLKREAKSSPLLSRIKNKLMKPSLEKPRKENSLKLEKVSLIQKSWKPLTQRANQWLTTRLF